MSDFSPRTPGSGVEAPDDPEDTVIRPREDYASLNGHGDGPPTLAQRIMAEKPPARRPERAAETPPARPAETPQHRGPSRHQTDGLAAQGSHAAASPQSAQRGAQPSAPQHLATPTRQPEGAAGRRTGEPVAVAGGGAVATGAVANAVPAPAPTGARPVGRSRDTAHRHAGSNKGAVRRTRKARLRLSRVDPWSVMKTAFLFSIAAAIVLLVAVYAIWGVIEASGLFAAIDSAVQDAVGTQGDTTPFRLETYINTPRVMGAAALIGVVDVVLITALATLASFLYNLAATVLGGLEVTLAED